MQQDSVFTQQKAKYKESGDVDQYPLGSIPSMGWGAEKM